MHFFKRTHPSPNKRDSEFSPYTLVLRAYCHRCMQSRPKSMRFCMIGLMSYNKRDLHLLKNAKLTGILLEID